MHVTISICILGVIFTLFGACTPYLNVPPKISEVTATHQNVYPRGTTELSCIASDNESDTLSFIWSSTDGEIIGSGPVITWRAPNKYGNFHIMVVVEDENGGSSQDTITISVVANENTETTNCCD